MNLILKKLITIATPTSLMRSGKDADRNKSTILRSDISALAANIITTTPTPDGDVTILYDSVATPSDIIISHYSDTQHHKYFLQII